MGNINDIKASYAVTVVSVSGCVSAWDGWVAHSVCLLVAKIVSCLYIVPCSKNASEKPAGGRCYVCNVPRL